MKNTISFKFEILFCNLDKFISCTCCTHIPKRSSNFNLQASWPFCYLESLMIVVDYSWPWVFLIFRSQLHELVCCYLSRIPLSMSCTLSKMLSFIGAFEDKHATAKLLKEEEEDGLRDLVRHTMFEKGQSKRIWGELYKVIDSSDVVVQVSVVTFCPCKKYSHSVKPSRHLWCFFFLKKKKWALIYLLILLFCTGVGCQGSNGY